MQLTNLDELLELTCNRIEYLDNFKRSPCEGLLLSMYDAVEKDFKDNLEILKLTTDNRLKKRQIKYMLRKTKRLRRQAWKLSFNTLQNEYLSNKFDMYNFEYQNIVNLTKDRKLFRSNKRSEIVKEKGKG